MKKHKNRNLAPYITVPHHPTPTSEVALREIMRAQPRLLAGLVDGGWSALLVGSRLTAESRVKKVFSGRTGGWQGSHWGQGEWSEPLTWVSIDQVVAPTVQERGMIYSRDYFQGELPRKSVRLGVTRTRAVGDNEGESAKKQSPLAQSLLSLLAQRM